MPKTGKERAVLSTKIATVARCNHLETREINVEEIVFLDTRNGLTEKGVREHSE
jgi:hypothetical protein